MPQRRTSIKALRVNERRHMRNLDIKTDLRKTVKKFQALIAAKNVKEAQTALHTLYKKFDKAAKRKIFHANTAARRKSKFSKLLSNIA